MIKKTKCSEGAFSTTRRHDNFAGVHTLLRKIYRVIHERGISEFLFTATHYTHCNNILISNFENNYN
jgi:hypothetical protein